MKISEMITDKYKLRIPPTVYYELLADVQEVEEEQEPTTKNDLGVDWENYKDADGNCLDDLILEVLQNNFDCGNTYGYKVADEIIELLPSVTPQEPRWISVSERLPDTDDEVLCWYEYYHWSQEKVLPEYGLGSYLTETSSWFGEVANGHKVRVIAWMPLPTPYEPQESEEQTE